LHYRFNPGNAGFGAVGPTGEGSEFDLNAWYHIAGVKEGEELRFYVNGEELRSSTALVVIFCLCDYIRDAVH